jgi:hypothetical protein
MSSVRLSAGPIAVLDAALEAARDATYAAQTSSIEVAGLPESHRLSDQLGHAAHAAGLESAFARRLLRLRDEFDSHVLAASMVEESGGRNARLLLRRGVDAVAAQLGEDG